MVGEDRRRTVSIIVVNWNGERFLNDCLEALDRQSYAEREIIFVDNGSTDSSVNLVRESFPNFELVELTENRGFTGGNSAGIRVATGEFIALVNNDTRVSERWLENLLHPMVEDPGIGICASKILIDGGNLINSAGDGLTTAAVGFNRGLEVDSSHYYDTEPLFGACGAAVLYRRKMLEEIGFLDEDFFLYDEDSDLNFRAQLSGWKCEYVPTAIVSHQVNATAVKLSDLHVYHHTRNLEFVWIKNMPSGLMLRFAHHKLIQEIGAFCYLCIRHMKWVPFFRAKRDALRMFPLMWRKRREIQREKKVSNHYIEKILTPMFSKHFIRQKIVQLVRG